MKAISKAQMIDLFSNIRRDGVENTNYDVDVFVSSHKPEEWYGCDDTGCEDLQPGAYCALWVDDTECSNMPSVGKWIDNYLKSDNIQLLSVKNSDKWIVLICLDLL